MVLSSIFLFVFPSYEALAQFSRFQQPLWHPSQDLIAVTNGFLLRVYRSDFSEVVHEFELTTLGRPDVRNMRWSPDGTMIGVLLQGGDIVPVLQVWNIVTDELVLELTNINTDSTIAWNPQSTRIAVSHERGLANDVLRIYELSTGSFEEYEYEGDIGAGRFIGYV